MFPLMFSTAIDQCVIGICAYCANCLDIASIDKHCKQRCVLASSGMQDTCFDVFGTGELDVPASRN